MITPESDTVAYEKNIGHVGKNTLELIHQYMHKLIPTIHYKQIRIIPEMLYMLRSGVLRCI